LAENEREKWLESELIAVKLTENERENGWNRSCIGRVIKQAYPAHVVVAAAAAACVPNLLRRGCYNRGVALKLAENERGKWLESELY
jgi:hypothetical protein